MKSWVKIAGAAALIVVIGIMAFFVRGNWGKMVDGTLQWIVGNVTGQDTEINMFQGAGDTNDDAVNEWNIK